MAKMTPELYQRVSQVLASALRRPQHDREPYLAEACGDDRELRREVETLLEYGPEADDLLEQEIPGKRPEPPPDLALAMPIPAPGDRIGPYELLERIDQGGMGTVFLACRRDDFEQKVALKLIRTDLLQTWRKEYPDDSELLQRFYRERQILANLDHPNIARILDGGATGDGVPYFTMEYVDGQPIDTWCNDRRLSIRNRLRLFSKVCSAVSLAHQSLVVHRDLKPGNILVDAVGEPRILDFGIAKRLVPATLDETLGQPTAAGQMPLTLRYASPEQIRGLAITTASDTYSLGVLLFQLLTGHFPYTLEDDQFLTLAKAICDQEPERPSSKIVREERIFRPEGTVTIDPHSVSSQRGASPEKLRRNLSGDVDSIVLKALAKDPKKRYVSVEQLALDIERCLEGRPVLAREGTTLYLAGKFVRRNWKSLVVVTTLLTTLGLAAEADRRARSAEEQQHLITQRLTQDLLTPFESALNRDQPVSTEAYLILLSQTLRLALEGESHLLAKPLGLFGTTLSRLHSHEAARDLLEESLRLHREHFDGDHPDLASLLNNLAASYDRAGNHDRAEELYREALAMKRRLGYESVGLAKATCNLASMLRLRGSYEKAEEHALECLRLRQEHTDPDPAAVARALRNLGILAYTRRRLGEAESWLLAARNRWARAAVDAPFETSAFSSSLGRVFHAQGRLVEAEALFTEVLTLRLAELEIDHEHVALARKDLGMVLLERGETETAGILLRQALETLRATRPADAWETAEAESLWGAYLAARGHLDLAAPFLTGGHEALAAARGEDSIHTFNARRRIERWLPSWTTWGQGVL